MQTPAVTNEQIVTLILGHFHDTQAVYIFGTYGTERELPDSDVDIALLLPVATARRVAGLALGPCWSSLGSLLCRDIDLINLRRVDTVFQNEIIQTGSIVFAGDGGEREAFEILTMAKYQKLSRERAEIVQEIVRSGRVLNT
jgi:predicted nucleotidyltransferase